MTGITSLGVTAVLVLGTLSHLGTTQNDGEAVCPYAALPTSIRCGSQPLTPQQTSNVRVSRAIIARIEALGEPIYAGSLEALQLGLDTPIVNLTPQQVSFYQTCLENNLLTFNDSFGEGLLPPTQRKKRQLNPICCTPSPTRVIIVASVDGNGAAVEVIQTPGAAQNFQDTNNCPSSSCAGVLCEAVETMVPADVVTLNSPLQFRKRNILVYICGARNQ